MPVAPTLHRPPSRGVGPPRRESLGRAVLTWTLVVLGPGVLWCGAAFVVGLLLPADPPPGQCEGIGFGCTLSPRDTAWFAAAYVGVAAVPIGTLTSVLAASLAPAGRRWVASLWSIGAMGAVVVAVMVALVAADGGLG